MEKWFYSKTQLPDGVRDLLFQDAFKRRWVQAKSVEVFSAWGYREVVTPTFEYLEAITAGKNLRLYEEIYKFIDRRGRVLALRPDMTIPIARVVASRFSSHPLPLRLYYTGSVFRCQELQKGRPHEFWQAGVELIGAGTAVADAEVITIAVECLNRAGLEDYRIGVGHVDFLGGILDEAGLEEERSAELRAALARRDYVGYEEAVRACDLDPARMQLMLTIPSLHGGIEVIDRASGMVSNPRSHRALANLGEVLGYLDAYGLGGRVYVELGLLRDIDYYTGMVFEGYAPGAGRPVCGGGRYDRLLEEFGRACGATGFALSVDEVIAALEGQGNCVCDEGLDYLLVPSRGQEKVAYEEARRLREKGYRVEVEVAGLSQRELAEYANARGVKQVLRIGEEE